MTEEERQRQMEFVVNQQARFDSSIAAGQREIKQIRRVLLSAIRFARRERSETRVKHDALTDAHTRLEDQVAASAAQWQEKLNALIDAQIRSEDKMAASQSRVDQALSELSASQSKLDLAMSDLSTALIHTNKRIDGFEQSNGNGEQH